VNRTSDIGALTHEAVLRVETGRELVVATGADRSRFLHGIVTGNVADTPPGRGALSALLTPKGHVLGDMRIFVRPDDLWIVVDAGQAEPIATGLARFAIMDDFAAAPRPDFAFSSLLGPAAADRLTAIGAAIDGGALAGAPLYAHAQFATPAGEIFVARVRELGTDGFWLGAPPATLTAVHERLAAAGTAALEPAAAEAARIVAVEPRFGAEITPDYFPMEVGLDAAIDYGKGCYLGQEPIVRIRDRGHINWRLVGLDLAGADDPAAHDPIETDVKPKAGRITSVGRLPDGRGVALAMLHVSIPVGATVRVRHGDARIEAQVRGEAPRAAAPAR
jgi:folate-binding protein YgfZ